MSNSFSLHLASPADSIDALRNRIAGHIILPADPAYHTARRTRGLVTYNRFPSMIVRTATPADVVEAVRFARHHGIPFPAHEHGLAMSTGSVGVGGLVTGGGIGWFGRKHGLAADRLLSARVVLADGETVTASATKNEDLFWAIRGGGGNFGIVVEFEFQLVPVKNIVGGAIVLPATRAVVRGYLEYSSTAPDGLSTTATITHAPPAPFIPEESVGAKVMIILAAWAGDPAEGEQAIAPLRALAEPIADTVGEIPYPPMFQYMAFAEEPHGAAIRMMFTDEVPDATIDDCLDAVENASSPASGVHLRGLGGQLARIDEGSTAFVHRDSRYFVAILGLWFDPEDDGAAHRAWTADIWATISHLRDGVYVNFLDAEGDARVREAYPEAVYGRLAEVRRNTTRRTSSSSTRTSGQPRR